MGRKLANVICNKALELGYDDCGIIKISSMSGYAEKLSERIRLFPASKSQMKNF